MLERDPPSPARAMGDRAGIGERRLDRAGLHGESAVGRQPIMMLGAPLRFGDDCAIRCNSRIAEIPEPTFKRRSRTAWRADSDARIAGRDANARRLESSFLLFRFRNDRRTWQRPP